MKTILVTKYHDYYSYSKEVLIKKFEKQRGFLAKRLSSSLDNQVDNVVSVIEERALWQKFGL